MDRFDAASLKYHSAGRKGKIEVVSSKSCDTDRSLSLAYTPGVAAPCKEIAKDPSKVFEYTARGNLVAVITNGTAVLGLGNIGPLASKPVMEGKAVLFKQFADIDVFDLELNARSTDEFIASVRTLEPTFGGINLEDIRAPECFEIEEALKKILSIPVFHDDQHGTAIVVSAALINACLISKRTLKDIKVVFSGAGAAAISCAKMFVTIGVPVPNIIMCDINGVIFNGRTVEMDKYKQTFAAETPHRTLKDALLGADVFVGLSAGNVVSPDMLKGMADRPIIFALANPAPEIDPVLARSASPNAIIATGRSDFPNQVNNLLGFPYIFRGALDVRASTINEEMKVAAANAIASLARETVPDSVSRAYGGKYFQFGPDYILPKPFDPRVLLAVAPAVAKAAMDTGVAGVPIVDFEEYKDQLQMIQGPMRSFIRTVIHRVVLNGMAGAKLPRIVFPEGCDPRILKAVDSVVEEKLARPVLLGEVDSIKAMIQELGLYHLDGVEIIDPRYAPDSAKCAEYLFENRKRKGVTRSEAERLAQSNIYYASLLVAMGLADGIVAGANDNYANCLKPVLEIIGAGKLGLAAGVSLVLFKGKVLFFADTSIIKCPTSEELAIIALHASRAAVHFGLEPRIAMLSYSNFTGETGVPDKMRRAAQILKVREPGLLVDGEMQADTALDPSIMERIFPFCEIRDGANILIFPNLESGNIGYKLLQQLGGGEVLGPYVMGLRRPANIVPQVSTVDQIFNTIAMTALQIQVFDKVHSAKTSGSDNLGSPTRDASGPFPQI